MKPQILLVEDEDAIAQTLIYALSTDGFAPTHVSLLAEARVALAQMKPALAVLDVGLPDGSGFELCREIRRGEYGYAKLPILMLTARSEEVDRIVGLELGADDYVTKPFSPREVSLRVKTILRRATADASTAQNPSNVRFEVDLGAQRIRFFEQSLALTKREYLLLKTLLERPGRICSREMLLDTVWGMDAESGDRTVDTHIKTLRGKLKAVRQDIDPIETHRGMGYSIAAVFAR
jgi:two-component system, OmpR family, catabolic regulation response regulator CreB